MKIGCGVSELCGSKIASPIDLAHGLYYHASHDTHKVSGKSKTVIAVFLKISYKVIYSNSNLSSLYIFKLHGITQVNLGCF